MANRDTGRGKSGPACVAACLLFPLAAFIAPAAEGEQAEPPPVSPFRPDAQSPPREDARPGTLTLSNGQVLKGLVTLTRGRKLEVFEDAANKWHRLELAEIRRLDNEVERETEEKEWRWKESGSDVKIYTGRTYVDRKYRLRVTPAGGQAGFVGHIRGTVIYVQPPAEEPRRFFLRQDERGDFGRKPDDMIYVRSVVLETAGASPEPPRDGPGAGRGGRPDAPQGKE